MKTKKYSVDPGRCAAFQAGRRAIATDALFWNRRALSTGVSIQRKNRDQDDRRESEFAVGCRRRVWDFVTAAGIRRAIHPTWSAKCGRIFVRKSPLAMPFAVEIIDHKLHENEANPNFGLLDENNCLITTTKRRARIQVKIDRGNLQNSTTTRRVPRRRCKHGDTRFFRTMLGPRKDCFPTSVHLSSKPKPHG